MNAQNALAMLDQAIGELVDQELNGASKNVSLKILDIPGNRRMVAGLISAPSTFANDREKDPRAKARGERYQQFLADKNSVVKKLKNVGVTPLGVVPTIAWEALCNRKGLLRFTPDQEGRVYVDAGIIEEAKRDVETQVSKEKTRQADFTFLSNVLMLCVVYLLAAWIGFLGFFSGAILWAEFCLHQNLKKPAQAGEAILLRGRIKTLIEKHSEEGTLCQVLWPNLVEPVDGGKVSIVLPPPPEAESVMILNAERTGMPLHVAVVPEAVRFTNFLDQELLEMEMERVRIEMERVEMERARRFDPIVFVQEGTAVAIVCQYGDLKIEREVIAEVIGALHLI